MAAARAPAVAVLNAALAHFEDADEEHIHDPWPVRHELADVWEENGSIRRNLRTQGKMLQWPRPELVGIATLQALGQNREAIYDALTVWAGSCSVAKSPPIEWLKDEASGMSKICFHGNVSQVLIVDAKC